jgi:Trk-type K+ transport system membrane component
LTLVVITIIELACFLALNYWLPVLDGLNWASRFIDGLFQSISTRNGKKKAIQGYVDFQYTDLSLSRFQPFLLAGFAVVSLMDLNPGTQLVYIVAMYISVYPVAISMRNSNVYQVRTAWTREML